MIKISLSSLARTNFSCPSEWDGKTDKQEAVTISYRCGQIKIFVNEVLVETTQKDDLDIAGYMEDEELKKILIRDEIAVDYSITGGGIDPQSGYSRRGIVTKPWLDMERPVPLSEIPDYNNFIAGIDASPKNRYAYQNRSKGRTVDIHYGNEGMYITFILLILLIIVTMIVLGKWYKNK